MPDVFEKQCNVSYQHRGQGAGAKKGLDIVQLNRKHPKEHGESVSLRSVQPHSSVSHDVPKHKHKSLADALEQWKIYNEKEQTMERGD